MFDDAGITMIDVSNGAKGQSTNFIDPEETPKTITDHVAFARDFLQPFGCTLWKCNMGARPAGGPTDDQLKRLADTLNEIGRQTIAMGIRMAPHPHIWGPVEREPEVRRMMELTDPKYVWLTPDTGHLTLGRHGRRADHERLLPAHCRGASQGHLRKISRQHLDADAGTAQGRERLPQPRRRRRRLPGVFKLLRDRRFKGWAIFDMDGPRAGDDGFDAIGGNLELAIDDYLSHNVNYLRVILGIKLPPLG